MMELVAIHCPHCKTENDSHLPKFSKEGMLVFCIRCRKVAHAIWRNKISTATWMSHPYDKERNHV